MPNPNHLFELSDDDFCYPSIIYDPYSDYSDSDNDLTGKIYLCFNCDDCKNDCKTCDIGQCYCDKSNHYNIHDYYYCEESKEEVKFSKFDESSDIHKLGLYHLSVLPPHGTTHNISIITNGNEYDSRFDDDDNNIIININEGVSIHVDEIMNILEIFKNRLDNDD